MALACGCEIKGGEPVSLDTIKAHYKHTMEAIFFWELLQRPGIDTGDQRMNLSMVRINLFEVLDKMFPEAEED